METSSPLTNSPKELSSLTVKLKPETEAVSQEHQAPQPLSLVTLMTERKPELDFPQVAEELFPVSAELWLASLPAVAELISPSVKLVTLTTLPRQRRTTGLRLEVWQ